MSGEETVRLAYDVYEPTVEKQVLESPLIFLHGMTSCRSTWYKFAQSFADETFRKVYLLDARNHGDSEWNDSSNYHLMAKDLSRFMSEQAITSAVVVGHSMGGKTAMALALSEPHKVEKLVVEDISPKRLEPASRRYPYRYLALLRESLNSIPLGSDLNTAKKIVSDFLFRNMPPEHSSPPEKRGDGSELPLRQTNYGFEWKTNLVVLDKMFFSPTYQHHSLEGCFHGSTLFIYGGKSPYNVINDKDDILKKFPKAQFYGIEGATHSVHFEFPEEFFKTVSAFINEQ